MQPQIPTPASFFFIIVSNPHLGGIISPARAHGGPNQSPKTARHTPQNYPISLSSFQKVKLCDASTNTHTSQILLHHTNSSTPGWGSFPIQGPRGPAPQPQNSRTCPQKLPIFPIMLSYGLLMVDKPAKLPIHIQIRTNNRGTDPKTDKYRLPEKQTDGWT